MIWDPSGPQYEAKKAYLQVRGLEGHKPSLNVLDVNLCSGYYLLCRYEVARTDQAETDSGIVLVIDKDDQTKKFPNIARIVHKAEQGCRLMVGDYAMCNAYGGNYHDDKKPQPFVRVFDDPARLWSIPDRDVPAGVGYERGKKEAEPECFGQYAEYMANADRCVSCGVLGECWRACLDRKG